MRFLVTLLISFFINTQAISATVNAGPSGFNQSGLMIGQYRTIHRKGIFTKHYAVPFLLGAGLGSAIAYPPIAFPLTLKKTDIKKTLQALPSDKPVVIHYQQQINHWRGWELLGLTPQTLITNVSEPEAIKMSNATHDQQWSALDETGELSTMQASGFLLRLYRFGTFDQLCSASVHLGGSKKYSTDLQETTLIGRDTDGHLIADTTAQLINKAEENVGHFNIASKKGCQFAEDSLRAGTMVEIEFSKRHFNFFDTRSMTIHAIQRLNHGLFSTPKN